MKTLIVIMGMFFIGCGPQFATVKYNPQESCTTTTNSLGSVITCPDGSTSTVLNGVGSTGPQGATGPQGPAGNNGVIDGTTLPDIINNYNIYRLSLGESVLQPGLTCSLYSVPTSTQNIATASLTFVQTFVYTGTFNVPNENVNLGMPILPANLQSIYQTWYIFKCKGYFVNTEAGNHSFNLSSDDGSALYIDANEVINNDGLHSDSSVGAIYSLDIGVHSFELDYFSGPPTNQALILDFDGDVIPTSNLFN